MNNKTIHVNDSMGVGLGRTLVEMENEHVCLSGRRLEEFRTRHCPFYLRQMCVNSSRCDMSHSETWPRRNPAHFRYDYKLCPNIQFFRNGNKMQLQGKCSYGRRCKFSHSKEEQLYHPDLYKTRYCVNYPNCKGYYCPFAHSKEELRTINRYSNYTQNGIHNTSDKFNGNCTSYKITRGEFSLVCYPTNYITNYVVENEVKELSIVEKVDGLVLEKETDTNSTCSNLDGESTIFSTNSSPSPQMSSNSSPVQLSNNLTPSPQSNNSSPSPQESPKLTREPGDLTRDLGDFSSDLTHLSPELRELSNDLQMSGLEEEDYNWFEDVIKSGLSLLDEEEKQQKTMGEKRCQICSGCLEKQKSSEATLESDHFSKQYQDIFKLWDKEF
ncbi:uncharacterized protein TA15175 [Theileria annulata]|uniref:C3H1-type domain-containing protein n=1 Tax=Theileria annulata TaxID=5874 RepID=Q4UFD0_THEAN|nr:uncharacterized protein TA15175 [Theileria annulata]CAI74186.1 hypothetical protein, conserved [Theileria annulata]|eukprot:XP_951918.1 hypothetical protein, conserved [Theileria annulata]